MREKQELEAKIIKAKHSTHISEEHECFMKKWSVSLSQGSLPWEETSSLLETFGIKSTFEHDNITQDVLFLFPKGIRVWMEGLRDLEASRFTTMVERGSARYYVLRCSTYPLEKKGWAYIWAS